MVNVNELQSVNALIPRSSGICVCCPIVPFVAFRPGTDRCSSLLSLALIYLRQYIWGLIMKQSSTESSSGCHGMFAPRVNTGNVLRRLAISMSHDYVHCSMHACGLRLTRLPTFQIVGLKPSLVATCPGGKCYRYKHAEALPMPSF